MSENKLGLNWSAVEKALAEGSFSGYKIGILETEKLFSEFLKNKQIPGRHVENKIKYIHRFLSLPDKLDYGRHLFKRIIHEPHFEISREETKQIISGYWQALLDIEEAIESLSLAEKIILRGRYVLGIVLKNLRRIFLVILAAAALIWALGETGFGRKFTEVVVKVNHFFIFKILFWATIILGVLVVLGGILYFISGRKRRF